MPTPGTYVKQEPTCVSSRTPDPSKGAGYLSK